MGTAGRTIGLSLLNAFVCASSVNALKEFSSLSDKVFLLKKGMYWWGIEAGGTERCDVDCWRRAACKRSSFERGAYARIGVSS